MLAGSRRTGVGLLALALTGAMVLAGPAVAQDPEEVAVPVEAQALLTYPINDVVPDTLLEAFPPVVVCVVEPQACPEETEALREPIADLLGQVDDNQQTLPVQPVLPTGLTVAFTGGTPRYASAVRFRLPEIPDGDQYDEFVLQVPQGQPSFSVDSPAFRRAVTAVVQLAASQDPEVFQQELAKVLEEEPVTQPLLGIEACPLTRPLPDDAAPPRSAPIRSIEQQNADGDFEPAVDCLYGANGRFDEASQTWSFALGLAARAWAAGDLENHGVLLRPTGAPNLAFGDPDTSTNAQVVLDLSSPPTATVASSQPPPPVEPLGGGTSLPTTDGGASTSPPLSSSSGGLSSAPGASAPQAAPPAEVAAPQTAPQGDQGVAAPEAAPVGAPVTPWHVWLLVPVFAAGAWLTARSLTEELATSTTRGGALTRLVEGAAS